MNRAMPTEPSTTTTADTDRLAQLVARKYECLLTLCEQGRRQQTLIAAGEVNALLALLSDKQRSLEQLQDLERQLDPWRRDDPRERHWRTPEQRERCGELLARCETLFREILGQEQESERTLRARRDETAARLANLDAAGRAQVAYAADATCATNQLDLAAE